MKSSRLDLRKNIFRSVPVFIIMTTVIIGALLAGCVMPPQQPQSSPSTRDGLSFSNVRQDGNTLLVDVTARNLPTIAGLQIGLKFDPAVLSYERATEGTFFNQGGAQTFFFDIKGQPTPGVVKDVVIARQGAGVSGSGTVVTLSFKVLASGNTRLDFEEVIGANEQAQKVDIVRQGADISVTLR